MRCKRVRSDLVAFHDGELVERDRERVVHHLNSCGPCAREAIRLRRIGTALAGLDRASLSSDFDERFWRRVAREGVPEPVRRWPTWLRAWSVTWRPLPLAAAACALLVVGYLAVDSYTSSERTRERSVDVPAALMEAPGLFVDYMIVASLDQLAHLEDIEAPSHSQPAADGVVPSLLRDQAEFFVEYPLLQKLEELESLDAVLDPTAGDRTGSYNG